MPSDPCLYRYSRCQLSARSCPLGRLEGLSDGAFAIAITLLVLELSVEPDAADDALRAILDEWRS